MVRQRILAPSFANSGQGGRNARSQYSRKKKVWEKTSGYCWHCGERVYFSSLDPDKPRGVECFHMDHLIPRSRGGSNKVANLVPACAGCNYRKWNHLGWKPAQLAGEANGAQA